ncbi:Ppx/GppA phosphatase family protein [Pantoea sp. At-9b]|uniref:Ppx/GppA phosphatase family protein n=1 Tax=Pantoea sp. (strain At-9b) TaxID=592316 RepID=UPI0001B40A39|nr:phosphatase [Pantoea sp. At-9b]ADU68848.1 Ppx/GppA phosphatase [Pantoea sp. At-9b]
MRLVVRVVVLFFAVFLPSLAFADNCWQTRAGIDMGSGATKIAVFEVNICQHQLGKVLFEDQRPVGYNDALARSTHNQLDETIQQQGLTALQQLVTQARRYHPQRISGVATAVFRSASNGQAVIDRFNQQAGVQLKIISQQQEAELGFRSAKAALHDPTLRDQDLLVWDIGGGSMQMTAWRDQPGQPVADVYQGKLASVTLKNFIVDVLKNQPAAQSPNPIGSWRPSVLRFVEFYAHNDVPPQIKQDLATRRVIGIGGVHGFSIKNQLKINDNRYDLATLEQVAKQQVWKGDSELTGDYRATDVSNLLLVEGYMHALGIKDVTVVKASLIQGIVLE